MENKPIFVKIEEYKDIRNILALAQAKLREAREILEEIEKLRHEEGAELELWKNEIEDTEHRTAFIHRSLFGE
ncbi:MAG TPA: hypothetical protein VJK52_01685 [Candidatus Nanoarchaeia archaeon]|nr:hypothetical protein [Candidatus Nanoarchaeia archaeon]